MERNTNESYLDYVRRCTQAVEERKMDYLEWGDCILGSENVYSSENLRKAFYVIAKILPKIDVSQLSSSTMEEIERLQNLQEEITREKIKCRDQRREMQKYITSEARFEHLVDILKEEIKAIDKDTSNKETIDNLITEPTNNTAILTLSDWHCGATVDTEWNHFNLSVLEDRVYSLYTQAMGLCKKFDVKELVIEIAGDMIEGGINISNKVLSEEDTVSQIILVSRLICQLVEYFAIRIPKIRIECVTGNHSRLVPNKTEATTKDNLERLFQEILPLRLAKYDNIEYSFSDSDIKTYCFNGKKIGLCHGQYDKISNVIENFVKLYKSVPSEIHLGHLHSFKDINDSDIRVMVNGSLKGSDEYAINACRATNSPSQTLVIYSDIGRTVTEIICE